jgi:hypothetical protein
MHPPIIRGAASPYELRYPDVGERETIAQLVARTQPLPELVVWAEQLGDVEWRKIPPRIVRMVSVTDRVLAEVRNATFGWDPENAGIVMRRPRTMAQLEQAFERSLYQLFGSFFMSTARDGRMHPTAYFLVLAAMRNQEDPWIGRRTLGQVAREMRGVPIVAISERPTLWETPRTIESVLQENGF